MAFTISFKDLDSPAKFTIDPRLPVIDSSRPWTFGADFERESHLPREKRKEWGDDPELIGLLRDYAAFLEMAGRLEEAEATLGEIPATLRQERHP